jgi:hypothetical protein
MILACFILLIINSHQSMAQENYYEETIIIDFDEIMSPIISFADEIYMMLNIIDSSDGRARRLFPANRVNKKIFHFSTK